MRELNCGERMTTPANPAFGIQQFSPAQQFFRSSSLMKWPADILTGTHAPASHVKCHPDGTVDTISLCSDGISWLDLGGKGAIDVTVGRM